MPGFAPSAGGTSRSFVLVMRALFVAPLALVSLIPVLTASGCPAGEPPQPAPLAPPSSEVPAAPVRRLTQAELNRTLRDLFPDVELPLVALSDGQQQAGSGAKFEGDVARQTPSDLVVEQLRAGAIAVSAQVIARPDLLFPRIPSADVEDQRAVGHEMIAAFGERALRRPFEGGELARYTALFDAVLAANGFDVAVQGVLQAFLQSPAFLYRLELAPSTGDDGDGEQVVRGYEMANRLSYFLWGTMPDPLLFERAADGSLDSEEGVRAEAERMLADQRAVDAILAFHRQWLDLDRILTVNKDPSAHPTYNEFMRQSMRTEADLFIESVVFGGDARLETLFTSNIAPVNNTLAGLYGVPLPNEEWAFVELPADQRAGILTQGQFLASRAHAVEGSPVLRGIFVLERFLCEPPPTPDGAIDTTPPEDDPDALTTNRQRFSQHTFDPVCQGCHVAIDGVGFGFEGYDAIGRYRTIDNGLPVDDSGSLDATAVGGTFHGAVELAHMLADSEAVQRCVARHWFCSSLGRNEARNDDASLASASEAFVDSDGDIKALLLAIIDSPSFRVRPALGGDT